MFKHSIGTLPIVIHELFTDNQSFHSYNTRYKSNLRQQVANREYMYRNFSFVGVYVWNHIKAKTTINTDVSYNSFKLCLKEYLFTNDINFRVV